VEGTAIAALLFNLDNSSEVLLLLKAKQVAIFDFQIPLVLVVMNVSYALSAYTVRILSDLLDRKTLLLWGCALNTVLYLGLAIAR
jgi:MFS family permease